MRTISSSLLLCIFLVFVVVLGAAAADADEEAKRRAIKLKTVGQLKKIFKELEITFDASMGKEELRELAYKEDAVERWLELHPEKRPKKTSAAPDEMPEGLDPEMWEQMQRQMKGDFSHVTDPEKRRILEKLSAKGIKMSGGGDMDLEQLIQLEKMLDGQNFPGMGDEM